MSRSTQTLVLLAIAGLVGCGGLSARLDGNLPRTGSVVPDSTVQISPSFGFPLEKLVFWGAYAGAAYLILDPLAPNWEIEETPLPGNLIHLSMKMKRYYAGGAGEGRAVFQRRARSLVQFGGFEGYDVLEYNEGLESSIFGAQRVSGGVIRLSGKGFMGRGSQEDQGSAPPARNIPDKATNPVS